MKKTIGVVIGASRDAIHAIKIAKKQGVYVVALDGNPNAEGFIYADEYVNVNISDMDAVCKVMDRIKPDFIIPVPIGRYLITTGYINEKYNLRGIKYRATELSTDKYLFHEEMNKNGLRDVRAYLINKTTEIDKIKIDYPAIMKPRFGSGSRDVFYIENDEELHKSYEKAIENDEDFILEQAVAGTEYGVDGAVINGEFNLVLLRKKINMPLPVCQAISYLSVDKNEKNLSLINNVYTYMNKVINVLKYENCLFHADLIINENRIFVIEASPRPSGHNLHNLFVSLTTGIDVLEEYTKYILNNEYSFETDKIRTMQIRFFDFENKVVSKVPSEKELKNSGKCNLIQWNCKIKVGDRMGKVTNGHSIMDRGFFVIEGKDESDLIRQSGWIMSQFKFYFNNNEVEKHG